VEIKMKILSALDLRKKLGAVLNEVSSQKEPVIISRANKPLAVLISVEDFELKVLKKDREDRLRAQSRRMDEWQARHRKETSRVDAVIAVREIREGR
jgi:prevent-host-death family protein